jgi:hypothetical protein
MLRLETDLHRQIPRPTLFQPRMARKKSPGGSLPEDFWARLATSAFALPGRSTRFLRGALASVARSPPMLTTGVASTTSCCRESRRMIGHLYDGSHFLRSLQHRCTTHPTMRPAYFRFFSASASDPPISPVPLADCVICRMDKRIE